MVSFYEVGRKLSKALHNDAIRYGRRRNKQRHVFIIALRYIAGLRQCAMVA